MRIIFHMWEEGGKEEEEIEDNKTLDLDSNRNLLG